MPNLTPYQNQSPKKSFLVKAIAILIIGGLIGFLISYNFFPHKIVLVGFKNIDAGKPEQVDFSLFWDVFETIEKKHIQQATLDYQNLLYGSIKGLVRAIGDPYSEFFSPKETKQFLQDVKGIFEGIGAEINKKEGFLIVVTPLANSPAEKAGLKAGDKIIKIDGEDATNLSLEQAVLKIRGPKGTTVILTVRRKQGQKEKELDISIRRSVIKIPTSKLEFKEGNIAYLRLFHFSENAHKQFAQQVKKILEKGSQKLILDLRNNPGGFLTEAVEIASFFLPKNEVVTIEDFGPTKDKIYYRSRGYNQLGNLKIVILVNEGSASASEILAGALRDLKGAKIVGTKTFGKGSVQEFLELPQATSLKITVAHWLTPAGHQIEGSGLEPDVLIQNPPDSDQDLQIEKALEIIKSL